MSSSRRDSGPAALMLLGVLVLLTSPMAFMAGLWLLPRHGDGMGTIGEAVVLAFGWAVLGLGLTIGAALAAAPGAAPPEDVGPPE